jgi:hypothetical protein
VAEDDRSQPKTARIFEHVLVRRTLRTPIWRSEIQRGIFAYTQGSADWGVSRLRFLKLKTSKFSVNLIAGSIYDSRVWGAVPYGLKKIYRTHNIRIKVFTRLTDGCCHRHLAGEVENAPHVPISKYFRYVRLLASVAVEELHWTQRPQPF